MRRQADATQTRGHGSYMLRRLCGVYSPPRLRAEGQGEVGEAASACRIDSRTPSRLSITSLFQKRMTR